jgi:hypothetical protein
VSSKWTAKEDRIQQTGDRMKGRKDDESPPLFKGEAEGILVEH